MGMVNFNPFVPPFVESVENIYKDFCMHVQVPGLTRATGQGEPMTLLDCLLSSSHSNGYKKLEIDSVIIKKTTDRRYTEAGLGSPGGTTAGVTGSDEETLMELDAMEGRINLYETNM